MRINRLKCVDVGAGVTLFFFFLLVHWIAGGAQWAVLTLQSILWSTAVKSTQGNKQTNMNVFFVCVCLCVWGGVESTDFLFIPLKCARWKTKYVYRFYVSNFDYEDIVHVKNNLLACWQSIGMKREQRKAQENGNRLTLSYQYSINKVKHTNTKCGKVMWAKANELTSSWGQINGWNRRNCWETKNIKRKRKPSLTHPLSFSLGWRLWVKLNWKTKIIVWNWIQECIRVCVCVYVRVCAWMDVIPLFVLMLLLLMLPSLL